ncbi:transporter substrate-binding domain-containing protein [Chromobacterium haemolyticum]|nr:transporter substrate-binding domain-containing protein [Chromobacterium haemolyticum]
MWKWGRTAGSAAGWRWRPCWPFWTISACRRRASRRCRGRGPTRRPRPRPGAAIFPIAKTRERLKHLNFAVKLLDSDVYFYQLATRRDIQAPTLAAAKRYSVCVVLGDYRQEYLKTEGFPRLDPTSDASINVKKLVSGRCDLLPATEIGMRRKLKSLGLDATLVRRGMKLSQLDSALYAAFNRGTAPEVIARFKAAARSVD